MSDTIVIDTKELAIVLGCAMLIGFLIGAAAARHTPPETKYVPVVYLPEASDAGYSVTFNVGKPRPQPARCFPAGSGRP